MSGYVYIGLYTLAVTCILSSSCLTSLLYAGLRCYDNTNWHGESVMKHLKTTDDLVVSSSFSGEQSEEIQDRSHYN